ncbi:GNAT family N-acetyltransferase [Brevibacillus sp. GCM10020057]|uniref:GNAT family N-acetyltransferase n=1 Tax=Brevibacillus sp. GCM10020057 TaxID=3317327 RepID=UPI00363BD3A9
MIREATPADADFAAPLIYEAIGGIAYTLTGTSEPACAIAEVRRFFAQAGNRLSYENAVVAVDGDKRVGLALFYHGSQTAVLDRPFVEHVERKTGKAPHIVKEARDDEFYLDTLVVSREYRGKGIGKALLEAFEQECRRRGFGKAALLVDEENGRARKLYESIGYREDGKIKVSGHWFSHMVKQAAVSV